MKTNTAPMFESYADATLARTRGTYAQRGTEYGDSWRNAQWLTLKAVCKSLGVKITDEHLIAIVVAGLCDVKYNRLEGGYKDDTIVDDIAYHAFLAEIMEQLKSKSSAQMTLVGIQQNLPTDFEEWSSRNRQMINGGAALATNGAAKATPEMGAASNGRSHL